MRFTPKDNPELLTPLEYDEIRSLTARIHQQLSAGTLDSPSWKLIRTAKLATRIYAPLGTEMSLGDYVRVVRTFIEAFKLAEAAANTNGVFSDGEGPGEEGLREDAKLRQLGADLQVKFPQNSKT